MKETYQLIKLIEKYGKPLKVPLINFHDENSLETKLYRHLEKELFSDDDAVKLLYGDLAKRDAFKMLKSRFKKKLYNQLLFLNLDSFSKIAAAEINCNRLILDANILYRGQEYSLAEKKIHQLLTIAKQYCLTNELVQGLEFYQKLLLDGYFNQLKYEKCESQLNEQFQIQLMERESTGLYNKVIISLNAGIASRQDISTKITDILIKVEQLWKDSKSPKIFKQFHKIKMAFYELTGRYNDLISFIKEMNLLYEKGMLNPHYFSLSFNLYILSYACLRMKAYEDGLQAIQKVLSLTEKSNYNWFVAIENYYLLNIHSKKYVEAGIILNDVYSSPFYGRLDNALKERWMLFSLFLGFITKDDSTKHISYVTQINKDKKGYNIWLIILEYLTFLKQGNYELLFREAERIRKYMSKYLDGKSDPRYKMFLKLLILVVKEEFNLIEIKKKSRYLVTKLHETLPTGDAYAEVEVVPFEHLWDFILDILKEQNVKHRKQLI